MGTVTKISQIFDAATLFARNLNQVYAEDGTNKRAIVVDRVPLMFVMVIPGDVPVHLAEPLELYAIVRTTGGLYTEEEIPPTFLDDVTG